MLDIILLLVVMVVLFLGITCLLYALAMCKEVKKKHDND